jgi:DNA-binding transcriptional regulator YiaG
MKRWKENIKGIGGLDYIIFKNVPMRESKYGDIIDFNPGLMEKMAAEAIIRSRVPIRGLEVNFLRKTLALSLDRLAKDLNLTAAAVRKWEVKETERLHPINEAAVRALFAEKLSVDMPGKFSELIGTEEGPNELILKAS